MLCVPRVAVCTPQVIVIYMQRDRTSYNDRQNIGCEVNVVYEPPEDGLI
jgi:hypothetical protein